MTARPTEEEDDIAAEINVTPFIDVMLVLLVVFMVAAPLSTVDVPVTLPTSAAEAAPPAADPIWLTVNVQGQWIVGDSPVAPESLGAALDLASGGDRGRAVMVRGDADLRYQQMVQVLDALRAAGYAKVALVARDTAAAAP